MFADRGDGSQRAEYESGVEGLDGLVEKGKVVDYDWAKASVAGQIYNDGWRCWVYVQRSMGFSGAGPEASTCFSPTTASTSILSAMVKQTEDSVWCGVGGGVGCGGLDAAMRSRDDGQLSQHEAGLGEAQRHTRVRAADTTRRS